MNGKERQRDEVVGEKEVREGGRDGNKVGGGKSFSNRRVKREQERREVKEDEREELWRGSRDREREGKRKSSRETMYRKGEGREERMAERSVFSVMCVCEAKISVIIIIFIP